MWYTVDYILLKRHTLSLCLLRALNKHDLLWASCSDVAKFEIVKANDNNSDVAQEMAKYPFFKEIDFGKLIYLAYL